MCHRTALASKPSSLKRDKRRFPAEEWEWSVDIQADFELITWRELSLQNAVTDLVSMMCTSVQTDLFIVMPHGESLFTKACTDEGQ